MSYPDPATLASIERCTESGHPCGCTQTRRPSGAPRWRLCSYHEGFDDGTERGLDIDERALRIGRAVRQPISNHFELVANYRARMIAAGEVEG